MSQNLGTVPKLYLVINYEGFPNYNLINSILLLLQAAGAEEKFVL